MSDQGEKILSLTQQILQQSTIVVARDSNHEHTENADRLKAAGLAALVVAAGDGVISHIAHDLNRAINRYERTELKALVFYASMKLGDSEMTITLRMMDDLGFVHTDDLTTADYRRIREYMWSLLMRAA